MSLSSGNDGSILQCLVLFDKYAFKMRNRELSIFQIFQDYVDKEACARENADKSAVRVKTEVKEEKDGSVDMNSAKAVEGTEVSKAEEVDKGKQAEVKQENNLEEKEEEEEEDGEEEEDEEEEEGEEDGEDDEEEEEVEEQMTRENCIQDFEDDGDVTDDDLNDVLASACMEEEIEDSEEGMSLELMCERG